MGAVKTVNKKNLLISLLDNGIARVEIPPDVDFGIDHARSVSEALKEFGEKRYPLLVVADEYSAPTPEARDFIANEKSNKYIRAEAYVIRNLSQKIVAKFYLTFNNPARPTEFFDDEQNAIEWLLKVSSDGATKR